MKAKSNGIFVFGSNLAGRHGKGAALSAMQRHGAVYGQGVGRTGMSYAIPTRGFNIETLPINQIAPHIGTFIEYAHLHPELEFFVTRVGCGFAGYTDEDMAPMFAKSPGNVILPNEWVTVLIRLWQEQGGEV